ncbi:MAG: zf-HC2 domain-containing protein [Pyrinomonadaceae bacterium]|nr:zf-HC2 domain-containing protein [Pyrinomonadaceae bacterium]
MTKEPANIINCSTFEELLTDYLDKTLENGVQRAVAEHALACPLCHSLLNDVRESLDVCHSISAPKMSMTRLEARVLAMTMPETAMTCEDFEGYLTDYLDGFLPAAVFHRWERHATLCTTCEDLPGMVVRSIAALYTYKSDELAVPAGLHDRILQSTIGTAQAAKVKAAWGAQIAEWLRGLSFPLPIPQFASVAMILLFAFMFFSQTVSADGSFTSVYQKSVELAEETYKQSAEAWNGGGTPSTPKAEPVSGTTFVDNEEKK